MNPAWRAALALALLAGCGDTSVEAVDAASDAGARADTPVGPSLVVGTGFPDYESVSEGDTPLFTHGPQGGFHLWGGFRAEGFNPDDVAIDFELRHEGEVIGSAFYEDRLRDMDSDGGYLYAGVAVAVTSDFQRRLLLPEWIRAVLDVGQSSDADFVRGPVQMWVRVDDNEGQVAEATVDVIAECCDL